MDHGRYLIEELCRLTGFSRRTVRYYVQEGLVDPPAGRGRGGYYSDLHATQLARIRRLQEQGYRLEAIRGMLATPDTAAKAEPARPAEPAPAATVEPGPAANTMGSSWTRHVVVPGVELHLSAEVASKVGPAVAAALEALRSIIQHHRGGLNE
jgi:DNA-binding transcriptional MerR regulator